MRPVFISAFLSFLALIVFPLQAGSDFGEQLFVPPPKGWAVVFHEIEDGAEITEVTPKGQNAANWTEILAISILDGKPVKSAQEALQERFAIIEAGCESVGAGPSNLAVENGFQTVMRAIACPKSTEWGKGEMSLIKVINGNERVYVIIRSWRGEPFAKGQLPLSDATTQQWLNFMSRVVLCDARYPERHPCPDPQAEFQPIEP